MDSSGEAEEFRDAGNKIMPAWYIGGTGQGLKVQFKGAGRAGDVDACQSPA